MRTTVTLDPDTAALLEQAMRERGIGFKEAINTAVRAGLGALGAAPEPFETPTFSMGVPKVDLDRVGEVLAALDTDELARLDRDEARHAPSPSAGR